MITWWLLDDHSNSGIGQYAVLPYSRVWDYLMLIRDYWGHLMTNNYQKKLSLFDDYFTVYLTPIIPMIQS